MIPRCSSTKVVQTVSVGCISRSRGQKIGFPNAIFKNLLVWNYKAQHFHIWYIASSRGPLTKLFKLCPWGQIWPCPWGHNFTLNYTVFHILYIFSYFIVLYFYSPMNEISNGKKVKWCLKVSILLKLIFCQNVSLPIMHNWLSRTIPMSKYFSGSRLLRHNEVQL